MGRQGPLVVEEEEEADESSAEVEEGVPCSSAGGRVWVRGRRGRCCGRIEGGGRGGLRGLFQPEMWGGRPAEGGGGRWE